MHSHPHKSSLLAALAAACLITATVHAAPPSDPQPGDANAAASQTALAIAGVAAMKPAAGGAQPAETAPAIAPAAAGGAQPAPPAARPMTQEQRHELMMLLIMRETSRNPFGALH
jgi:hypothetical protein